MVSGPWDLKDRIENVPAIQDDGEELRTLPTVGQLVEVRARSHTIKDS